MAGFTLIQASGGKFVILIVAAPRTLKTLRPANLEQILQTLQIDLEPQATTSLDISPFIPLAK